MSFEKGETVDEKECEYEYAGRNQHRRWVV